MIGEEWINYEIRVLSGGIDMKQGDRVYISGDSKELWIKDYNVRVSTNAIVEETPKKNAKKVLVTLD
jgi:hypothetical protein